MTLKNPVIAMYIHVDAGIFPSNYDVRFCMYIIANFPKQVYFFHESISFPTFMGDFMGAALGASWGLPGGFLGTSW